MTIYFSIVDVTLFNSLRCHAVKVDRNGAYLVMDVRRNGTTWVIAVRTVDDNLTLMKQIDGFYHKLQVFSSNSRWLFVRGDPNKLYLYDVLGDDGQIPEEISFGDSENAPINFRWMGEGRLLLGTPVENDRSDVLKIYTV